MSQKAMVFIDGGWLHRSRATLFSKLGEDNFEIDYAKLPKIFCEDVANRLDEDISLVRTNYFGTIPSARSGFNTSKQYAFYDFLERNCGYETEIHEIDVGTDENWIKMSLASSLMFYAARHCDRRWRRPRLCAGSQADTSLRQADTDCRRAHSGWESPRRGSHPRHALARE